MEFPGLLRLIFAFSFLASIGLLLFVCLHALITPELTSQQQAATVWAFFIGSVTAVVSGVSCVLAD